MSGSLALACRANSGGGGNVLSCCHSACAVLDSVTISLSPSLASIDLPFHSPQRQPSPAHSDYRAYSYHFEIEKRFTKKFQTWKNTGIMGYRSVPRRPRQP